MTPEVSKELRALAVDLGRVPLPVLGLYAVAPEDRYVAVLDERPDDPAAATIGELHADLRASGTSLRGAWAVRADLASPMALGRRWWSVRPDSDDARLDATANTAVRRWVLRERGVAVLGPPPADLVAPVTAAVLAAEGLGLARTRGEAIENDPALLEGPATRAALVEELTVALHAGVEGTVTGPAAALAWCRDRLPDQGPALDPGAGPADVRRLVWEVHSRLGTLVATRGDQVGP